MKPKVSILVANYNYGKWIGQCLQSALNQTYDNIVITVVDDNSTDNSVEIAKDVLKIKDGTEFKSSKYTGYIGLNGHRVYKLNENSGPAAARNLAIDSTLSESDLFMVLDADDYIVPTKVEKMVNEITKFDRVGLVYADYFIVNDKGEEKYEFKRTYSGTKLMNECIVHSACMFSKEVLIEAKDEYGYFDNRIKGPEDYDLWLRIAEKKMILHLAEPLSFARVTGQNISNTKSEQNKKNYEEGFKVLNQKLQERYARVAAN